MSHRFLKAKNFFLLWPIFIGNLLYSFHYNVLVYVNSSYLSEYFNPGLVSILYVLGSIGSIALFFLAVYLENKFGNKKFLSLFLFLELIAVFGLAVASTHLAIALFFIIFESTSLMIVYAFDIFLLDATPTKDTGVVRGAYLTLANISLVLSPLLITIFAPNGEFTNLFILSLFFLLPLFILAHFSFRHFKDGLPRVLGLPIKEWLKAKNVRRVTEVRLVLDIFYAFMVIYMPIYLHTHIGFSWSEIGAIFTIMLLPFVLFEVPIGRLADRFCGEKELMTLGLFIIGCVLILVPFIKTPSVLLWTILLFISRVGASTVETTCESYFFKHVDKRDTGLISIYRLSWPVAFIIGPIIGAFSLALFPFEAMFFILALLMLKIMSTSAKLQDTL